MTVSALLLAPPPRPGAPDPPMAGPQSKVVSGLCSWDAQASGPQEEGHGPAAPREERCLCHGHAGPAALPQWDHSAPTNCVLGRWPPAHTHSRRGEEVYSTEPASQDWAHALTVSRLHQVRGGGGHRPLSGDAGSGAAGPPVERAFVSDSGDAAGVPFGSFYRWE